MARRISDAFSFRNLLEVINHELEHASKIVKEKLSQEKVSQKEVMKYLNATFDNILEKLSQDEVMEEKINAEVENE
nr:hypothetical protein [Tanacetum cinerariifolium]